MNHLYIQTAFLGDLLLSVPALKQIRQVYPKAQISLVCRKSLGSLMSDLGVVDEVFEVDKTNKNDLPEKLSDRRFDTIYCPHQSYSSYRLVKALSAQKKVGYKKIWNSGGFDVRVERRLDWPEAIRQLQLVAATSENVEIKLEAFEQKPDSFPQWSEMYLSQLHWKEARVQELVDRKVQGFRVTSPYVCIAPGSVWETKRWTESSFVKVATALARENFQIIIIGAPDERELCERVQGNVPNSISLAGNLSILESLMVLSKAKGLICNDSGAMHMASLLQLPTISMFGPTVQELGYKPWNAKARVFEMNELLCRPCGQHGGRSCPIGSHICMSKISTKQVAEAAFSAFS